MKTHAQLTREAEGDLAEAFDYYEAQLSGLGYEFVASVEQQIEWVVENPAQYRFGIGDVYCRRSSRRRRCSGGIQAALVPASDRIVWECPLCGDNGLIRGWRGTIWDRRAPIRPIEEAASDLAEDADAETLPESLAHRAELDGRLHDLELDPEASSSWD